MDYQDYIEEKFRQHILRFWSRERQIKFCLHILGDEAQLWWANKQAAQQSVQADGLTICQNCGSWLRAGECENCYSPVAPARR